MRLFLLLSSFFFTVGASSAQQLNSSFDFEDTFSDTEARFAFTPNGNVSFEPGPTGQAISLTGESWLDLPSEVASLIDTDSTLFFSADVFVSSSVPENSARMLFGNKDFFFHSTGYSLMLYRRPGESMRLRFNFASVSDEGLPQEVAVDLGNVPYDSWLRISLEMNFDTDVVTVFFGGQRWFGSMLSDANLNAVDYSALFERMTSVPPRVGGPTAEEPGDEESYESSEAWSNNRMPILLDNVQIASPREPGNKAAVISSIQGLTEHLDGTRTLNTSELEEAALNIRRELFNIELRDIVAPVRSFIESFSQVNGPVYSRDGWLDESFRDHSIVEQAYIDLGVWMMNTALTPENASVAEGIRLPDHTIFPGEVDSGAERVSDERVLVDATFNPDPFHRLGGIQFRPSGPLSSIIFRPTGFYAPAGEVITISVDPSLVASGAYIRVGAHHLNYLSLPASARFPKISVDYPIDTETMAVVNPMGGGIYVTVPQGADLGVVPITISGAVRAPYYSFRDGQETSEAEWSIAKSYPAPWADFESDKYQITVWSKDIRDFDRPDTLMARWNRAMDVYQHIFGRPTERARPEAFLLDVTSSTVGSYPAGYPQIPGIWATKSEDITQGDFSPFALMGYAPWEQPDGGDWIPMLHEIGHSHTPYTLDGTLFNRDINEWEVIVDVPTVAVLNTVMGYDLDYAMTYGGNQPMNRSEAAIDWMVQPNFRNGDAIGIDPVTGEHEMRYQARSRAKYVDMADIFGSWDGMHAMYKVWYDRDVAVGDTLRFNIQIGRERDDILLDGSSALGCNLGSLFHFWGIHPSANAWETLSQYDPCPGALDRIRHYLRNAPRDNEEIRAFHASQQDGNYNPLLAAPWNLYRANFGLSEGVEIKSAGADILRQYFDVNPDSPPSLPVPLIGTFDVSSDIGDQTFSWTAGVDPEGSPLTYNWKLVDMATNEVIVSRSTISGTSVTVPTAEIRDAVQAAGGDGIHLGQFLVTADEFSIVVSNLLVSAVSAGSATEVGLVDKSPLPLNNLAQDRLIASNGLAVSIDLSSLFLDGTLSGLTYSASSSNPAAVSVSVNGMLLALEGRNEGTSQITITANDGTSSAELTFEVTSRINTPPGTVADRYVYFEDEFKTINPGEGVLANDIDAESDGMVAHLISKPDTGRLDFFENGGFHFTIPDNWNGTTSFTYIATDGLENSEVTMVELYVDPRNDAPEATALLSPSSGADILVSGNPEDDVAFVWNAAVDVDGDTLTYTWILQDGGGTEMMRLAAADTSLVVSVEAMATLLDDHQATFNQSFTARHRVDVSDEELTTLGSWQTFQFIRGAVTDLESIGQLPETLTLAPNYPNPFNPITVLRYGVPESGPVSLKLFDILGREIATLVEATRTAGWHEIVFDASHLGSGAYIQVLQYGGKRVSRTLLLVK